jgi:hypothetical protein
VRRYYTWAVTQIVSQDRQPQTVVVWCNQMSHLNAHLQCLTDMPCMTLGDSLGVFRCCNDADHRGCNRIGVWESDEDTERVVLSLSV